MPRQAGFTLVEIAIVLVIIGLLLGGVLKVQELIENGRIKNAVATLNGTSVAVNAYRDRYRSLPGDDRGAQERGWASADNGGGDGVLGSAGDDPFATGGASENIGFWRHLRFAGLIKGNPETTGADARPRQDNPFDGEMGVTFGVLAGPAGGSMPLSLCMANVPGKAAISMDNQMDDGVPATGSVRASVQTAVTTAPAATAASGAYTENSHYAVCRTL